LQVPSSEPLTTKEPDAAGRTTDTAPRCSSRCATSTPRGTQSSAARRGIDADTAAATASWTDAAP